MKDEEKFRQVRRIREDYRTDEKKVISRNDELSSRGFREIREKKGWLIVAIIFGVLTIATFAASNDWAENLWWNVARIAVTVIFASMIFIYKPSFPKWPERTQKFAKTLMWVIPSLVLIFAIIQLIWPQFAILMIRDLNHTWNYRRAIFIKSGFEMATAVIFAVIFAKNARARKFWPTIFAGLFCLVLVLMAGEELSWGQRIFQWSTPEFFKENNWQSETNLHNLNTPLFQNVLYLGGFLLLVILPIFREFFVGIVAKFRRFKFVANWLPPRYFALIFLAIFSLGDPVWSWAGTRYGSNLFIVIASLAVMIYLVITSRKVEKLARGQIIFAGTIFAVVATCNLFFSKVYDSNQGTPTEYLEMFIAFGILYWVANLFKRNYSRESEIRNRESNDISRNGLERNFEIRARGGYRENGK